MDDVEITYEIQRRDFAEANAVSFRASRRSTLPIWGILGSAILLVVLPLTYKEPPKDWSYPYLVIPFAAYLFYLAVLWISPFLNGTIGYPRASLANRQYKARLSNEEVRVSGEHVTWIHQWPSFPLIQETKNLFIFFDGTTMFIFAKRYFTSPQIETVQRLISEHRKTASVAVTR
jgi:hypothetical protein